MYPRINRLIAGAIFLFALILYIATMAPTVSFWDCGEFIATAHILGVPHPPGSPLYLLVGRIFTMLPFFEDIGARANLISPLTSALAVMFLYLSVVHLVRKWRREVTSVDEALIAYGSATVAALTFMVTDSHWFNAVEAEVYSISTFLTAFVVWLILRWSQRDETKSHVHHILILAYVLGLATGIHLLNLLALPFIALVIYFRRREFTWGGFFATAGITLVVFTVIYKGIIKGLPQLSAYLGVGSMVVSVIALFVATGWVIYRHQKSASIMLTSLLLIVIGYSTYATIFIRSNQNPAIDENDPETTASAVAYLEREQYGDWSITDRARWTPATQNRYTSVSDFVWNYQFEKMYIRYFLWQFAGRGPSIAPGVSPFGATNAEDGVDWFRFGLPLALVLGLFGMSYHFRKDWKHGLAVMALFLATGLMVIIYLNQPDPQPRERDYSYVGSFFAWSIWIGIGVAGLLEILTEKLRALNTQRLGLIAGLAAITILMPGVMLIASYHEHDRSGNYVAWDYSYNLLNSCEEGGILFTNGDNDTFPLWYLQEVEGVRKDVRIVNLSLLNTDWYIRQLKDMEPTIPLALTDQEITFMRPIPWETRQLSLPAKLPDGQDGSLQWTLRPTFMDRYLRVQDRMVVQIIKDINWIRPIYFAVTVSPENKIGLERYLDMQGLVYELKPEQVRGQVNIAKLEHNLLNVYRYRNLDNPAVHYNMNIQRLMQNVRASFLQVAVDAIIKKDLERVKKFLDALDASIPESVIPVTNKDLYMQMSDIYGAAGDTTEMVRRLAEFPQRFALSLSDSLGLGRLYLERLHDRATADAYLQPLYANHPFDGGVVGALVNIYRNHDNPKALAILEDWLARNPNDRLAVQLRDSLRQKVR